MMKIESNSLAYSMILDDMLQNFSFELGIDMDNNETPFGKYWKAVNTKSHSKNAQISQLTRVLRQLDSGDNQSKQSLYDFMNLIEIDEGTPYYIRSFIADFGKSRSSWNLQTPEGVEAVKKIYNNNLDQAYMWGQIENEVVVDFWQHLEGNSKEVSKPKELPKVPEKEVLNDLSSPQNPSPIQSQPVNSPSIQKNDSLPHKMPSENKEKEKSENKEDSKGKVQEEEIVEVKEDLPKEEPVPFKMKNNPSQFPRKPSNAIKEREANDSISPVYEGSLNRSKEPRKVDQQCANQQRDGVQDLLHHGAFFPETITKTDSRSDNVN